MSYIYKLYFILFVPYSPPQNLSGAPLPISPNFMSPTFIVINNHLRQITTVQMCIVVGITPGAWNISKA